MGEFNIEIVEMI